MFAGLAEQTTGRITLVTPDLPGRGSSYDRPPFLRMQDAVEYLLPVLQGRADRSYGLFGYSMGAMIAYELVCRLMDLNGPLPAVLIAAATRAPQVPARELPLHLMDDDALIGELVRFQGTPPEMLEDSELMALVLPRLRADFQLCETYQFAHRRQIPVPVYALGGREDEKVTAADLAAWLPLSVMGGTFEQLPGGHFFIDMQKEALARRIKAMMSSLNSQGASVGSVWYG